VFGLQILELSIKPIIFRIRDARLVEDVVAVVVQVQLCAQFQDSLFDGVHTVFSRKAKEQPKLLI
jgi:hypothetical protein